MATLYYRPYTTELQNDDNSSMVSAQDDVLPEFQYIFDNNSPDDDYDNLEMKPPKSADDMNRYKLAMRRMSTEIMQLRDQMKNLAAKNCTLRCDQCGHDRDPDIGYAEIVDLEKVSKDDLLRKYVNLKMKYDEACSDLTIYQEKVHKFQRDLIKKNNQEAEFIKMNKAHSSQNMLIQNLQKRIAKVKQLEDTVKTQELIISKMEKQIEKKNAVGVRLASEKKLTPIIEVSSSRENGYSSLLQDENLRLKQEIERLKMTRLTTISDSNMSDSERLELYQLLDRAEQRILALEKQVSISQRDRQNDQHRTSGRDDFGLSKIKF